MLADGTFGTAGAPFFYSSLTTVNYRLTVTDTMTGEETVYGNNTDQPLCGRTDLLFRQRKTRVDRVRDRNAGEESTLRLLGGRFSVTLEARRARDGRTAPGVITASGDVYGIFSLPGITGDETFPEVAVKMVDARSFTGTFWFFYTGLTSLDYTLTVTDAVTGAVQTYTNTTPFCGAADTKAFTDRSAPHSTPPDAERDHYADGTDADADADPATCFLSIQVELQQEADGRVTGQFATDCRQKVPETIYIWVLRSTPRPPA